MTRYTIGAGSRVMVRARSNIHDTEATWGRVGGNIELTSPDRVGLAAAAATVRVDMTQFDAGDFLRNRKLRKDLQVERNPEAVFELAALRELTETEPGRFKAAADGTLVWRGRRVPVRASGSGRVSDGSIEAEAEFELDVTSLGVEPPRFLMFKVERDVRVTVTLRASAG